MQRGCVLKMMRPFRQTHAHVLLITQERSETVVMSPDSRNIFNGPQAWCFFQKKLLVMARTAERKECAAREMRFVILRAKGEVKKFAERFNCCCLLSN